MVKKGRVDMWLNRWRDRKKRKEGRKKVGKKERMDGEKIRKKGDLSFGF